ncbi:PH domain-containing protein [Cytobacillus sp. IB215316]|uniref:PH domain-containing protein n=1 Tax=Cytobacillus sp. IB215316 TaxID=3097354 RepID=UPI002A1150C8|nr:PH domain-containing protein [Cytobacillus sp. IB215316]MDX8362828.1 PH domain-containing protein [Cytobacillus sp. IB215316]
MRDIPINRISTRALPVWRIGGIIEFLVSLIAFIVLLILTIIYHWSIWIIVVGSLLTLVMGYTFIMLIPKLRWKRWRYEVNEHEIDIQHGIFIIKRTLIPMVRVQHVDTKQGPILRKYSLATVTVSTAATVHEIPALDLNEADELRDRISILARVEDD